MEDKKDKSKDTLKNVSVLVGAIPVLTSAITYIAGEPQRHDLQIYQAWQVITTAHNQPGSGGRVQALEFLNSEPKINPWFFLHWERESLSGLEAPKAYLFPSRKFNKKVGIQLSEADLSNANLQEAILIYANLQGADLTDANLQRAELWKANLQRADLTGANLQGAEPWNANLQGANLTGTNLQGAKLTSADLQGANLIGANLQGANLIGANLQKAKYTDKSGSFETCKPLLEKQRPCSTTFPPNFNPSTAGMELAK